MPEITGHAAEREHEVVVAQFATVKDDAPFSESHVEGFIHEDGHAFLIG